MYLRILFIIIVIISFKLGMCCKSFSSSKKLQALASFQESPFSLSLSAKRFCKHEEDEKWGWGEGICPLIDYSKKLIHQSTTKKRSEVSKLHARGSIRLEEKQHHRTELTAAISFTGFISYHRYILPYCANQYYFVYKYKDKTIFMLVSCIVPR